MRTIEIDFDVYKEITLRRESEEVTPNDVLRELFDLPKIDQKPQEPSGKYWVAQDVRFPEGTEFRKVYKGKMYNAVVKDGALVLDGKRYFSPSSAAIKVTGGNINGWRFWECRMPGDSEWTIIDNLRK